MVRKVLYITHQLANSYFGGAETQMHNTMTQVNSSQKEIQVKLYNMWADRLDEYEIIHIFNPRAFPSESFNIAAYAKSKGIKLVVSPVFYHFSGVKDANRRSFWDMLSEKLSENFRPIYHFPLFKNFDPYQNMGKILNKADRILPNTHEELRLLDRFFGIDESKCTVVPNAAESRFTEGDPDLFRRHFGIDDFILFIGRIEPQKNVLALLRAFQASNLDAKLVIIGKDVNKDYAATCHKVAGKDVVFIPSIPHDSELLRSAYKAARVVALPSYYETPGLVALEGGLAGANVVITKNGGTREYFGEHAYYADPESIDSIRDALVKAYNKPKGPELSDSIRKNFTWENAGSLTLNAYRSI